MGPTGSPEAGGLPAVHLSPRGLLRDPPPVIGQGPCPGVGQLPCRGPVPGRVSAESSLEAEWLKHRGDKFPKENLAGGGQAGLGTVHPGVPLLASEFLLSLEKQSSRLEDVRPPPQDLPLCPTVQPKRPKLSPAPQSLPAVGQAPDEG